MCQLTVTNLNNKLWNVQAMLFSLYINSRITNQDGTGILSSLGTIYKNPEPPRLSENLGKWLYEVEKDGPIYGHVRQATTGAKKDIADTHPFEGKNVILFHNGTLTRKVPKNEDAGKVDSFVFMTDLDAKLEHNHDMVKALQESMEEFQGKFAFILFDKRTKSSYVARGTTAPLHIAYLLDENNHSIGYWINTQLSDLEEAITLFLDMLEATTGVKKFFSKTEMLQAESIYKLGPVDVERIGDLKENFPPVFKGAMERTNGWTSGWNGATINPSVLVDTNVVTITEIMDRFGFSLSTLNEIAIASLGIGILQFNQADVNTFVEMVLQKMSCPRKFRKMVKSLQAFVPISFYTENNFEFPYPMIREEQNQNAFIKALEKWKKNLSKE